MFVLNLTPIFKARGINNPYNFLIKAGLSPHVATNLAHNKALVLSLKHMETLCVLLFCEPNDLFLWTADKNHQLADNHPLQNFTNQEIVKKNYQDMFSTMSLKQLKEITKALENKTAI